MIRVSYFKKGFPFVIEHNFLGPDYKNLDLFLEVLLEKEDVVSFTVSKLPLK